MQYEIGRLGSWIMLVIALAVSIETIRYSSRNKIKEVGRSVLSVIEYVSLLILVWFLILTFPVVNLPITLYWLTWFLGMGYADKIQADRSSNSEKGN